MILVADESIDRQIVYQLRNCGYRVISVAEMDPGMTDAEVFELANAQDALLITADKDFGEIVFRQRRVNRGVILVRLAGLPQEKKGYLVATALRKYLLEMCNSYTVITPCRVRIRKMSKQITLPAAIYKKLGIQPGQKNVIRSSRRQNYSFAEDYKLYGTAGRFIEERLWPNFRRG